MRAPGSATSKKPGVRQRFRDAALMPPYAYSAPVHAAQQDGIGDWWSERWLAYNAFVFIHGLLSVIALLLFSSLPPSPFSRETGWPDPLAALAAPIALPIGINIAFLAGPALHSVATLLWRNKTRLAGPILLRIGICFSVLIIYLPPATQASHWLRDVYRLISS
jgi:hypothetical protein